jgi:hypothetical protein
MSEDNNRTEPENSDDFDAHQGHFSQFRTGYHWRNISAGPKDFGRILKVVVCVPPRACVNQASDINQPSAGLSP